MRIITSVAPLTLAVLTTGCKRDFVIPAYLYIPYVEISTNYALEGSASHKIIDAWVYVDDNAQGVFQLPAKIPLPFAGNHKVSILAGVLKDGKSVERIAYPFYSSFSQDLELTSKQVDTVVPILGYIGSTTFLVIENFDAPSSAFGLTRTTDVVFEGTGSGLIRLIPSNTEITSESNYYPIPHDGSRVFLEFDYQNQTVFDILIQDSEILQDQYIITITPKDLWNKVYVDLTAFVNRSPADQYRIKFRCALPDGVSEAVNYWDNIKILHL